MILNNVAENVGGFAFRKLIGIDFFLRMRFGEQIFGLFCQLWVSELLLDAVHILTGNGTCLDILQAETQVADFAKAKDRAHHIAGQECCLSYDRFFVPSR